MKRFVAVVFFVSHFFTQNLSSIGRVAAQNYFEGGFGIAFINGTPYTSLTLTPEFSVGKFAIGLNVELLFTKEGFEFRENMYKDGAGWLRIIRYLKYGQKGETFYTRFGTIDNAVLGNGFLMFHYSNESNYSRRKLGLQFDIDFEDFGFESIYSNFMRSEILGLRAYLRPLARLAIPIISTLEIGFSYVTDMHNTKRATRNDTILIKDHISASGFDLTFLVINNDYMKIKTYYDYGSIMNYGSGSAVGASLVIPSVLGLFEFGATYEIRWIGKYFAPNLFNATYERLRASHGVSSYIESIQTTRGHFSELALSILRTITVRGNYSKIYGNPLGGLFHAEASIPSLGPFYLSARFTKTQLERIDESFSLDPRAIAELELGFELSKHLFLTATYRYNWIEVKDKVTNKTKIEIQKRVIPQIKFRAFF